MSYELGFHPDALSEWRRLDDSVRAMFKKKLTERLLQPRVPAARLGAHPDRYKIKLRAVGYRLVYEVRDAQVIVVVVAVGKRERSAVDKAASGRLLTDALQASPHPELEIEPGRSSMPVRSVKL
jgi:mRNA interferase RelE/StbE